MACAYFAGGCFWCITPIFMAYGADRVVAGYCGGKEVNPTYEMVKSQKSGHRECVAVYYDENKINYEQLVDIYLANVDPFDGGGQYIDRGFSYTLAIFYNDDKEKEIAYKKIEELETRSKQKVFISIERFNCFYRAEEYHQDYYLKNPKAFEKELIESGRKK